MATEHDVKLALAAVSDQLAKHPHVTGLGIGSAHEPGDAVLLVYLDHEAAKRDTSLHATIPSSVEITRPNGAKMAVPIQVIEQDELKFE